MFTYSVKYGPSGHDVDDIPSASKAVSVVKQAMKKKGISWIFVESSDGGEAEYVKPRRGGWGLHKVKNCMNIVHVVVDVGVK